MTIPPERPEPLIPKEKPTGRGRDVFPPPPKPKKEPGTSSSESVRKVRPVAPKPDTTRHGTTYGPSSFVIAVILVGFIALLLLTVLVPMIAQEQSVPLKHPILKCYMVNGQVIEVIQIDGADYLNIYEGDSTRLVPVSEVQAEECD